MDRDCYAKLPRAGKAAAEAVERAVRRDEPADPREICPFFGKLFAAAGGVPTLAAVLQAIDDIPPLLARSGAVDAEALIGRLERIGGLHGQSILDQILVREAKRAVIAEILDARQLVASFVTATIHRFCVDSQRRVDGRWDQAGDALRAGGVPRDTLRRVLEPVTDAVVPKLLARPDARRLVGLPKPARIGAHDDLTGGAS